MKYPRYKYMFAFFDGGFTEFKMKGGRGDNINCITGIHQLFNIVKGGKLVFFAHGFSVFRGGVIETHEFYAVDFFPVVEVKFSKVTHAKNTNFKHNRFFDQRYVPGRESGILSLE